MELLDSTKASAAGKSIADWRKVVGEYLKAKRSGPTPGSAGALGKSAANKRAHPTISLLRRAL